MAFSSVFSSPSTTHTRASWLSSPLPASIPPLPVKLSLGFRSPNSHSLSFTPLRSRNAVYARAASGKSLYDFTVKDIDRKEISLGDFKGKLLLIVNVASQCGLTSSNYKELTQLYDKYKSKGFEILAFPCNQFGFQEPGSNQEIKSFACTRYKAEFPIFDKVDVNGPFTAPVYQFLKSSSGGFLGDLIKWNFEKFLVDKNGKVVERYPQQHPLSKLRRIFKSFLQLKTSKFKCYIQDTKNGCGLDEMDANFILL